MGLSARVLILAAPLLSSFISTIVTASPVDYSENLGVIDDTLIVKRQAVDHSNIGPEDETDAEIAADGTGPLRKGISRIALPQVTPSLLITRQLSMLDLSTYRTRRLQLGTKST